MNSDIEYEKCLLSFVDILGFTNFVTSKDQNNNYAYKPNALHNLLSIHKNSHICVSENYEPPKAFTISDAIIRIHQPNHNVSLIKSFYKEIYSLCYTQMDLFRYDILIRGAITYGDLYLDNDLMFGPCFIEAYNLEKDKAVYSRIILSENLVKTFEQTIVKNLDECCHTHNSVNANLSYYLRLDNKGVYYLDYLKVIFEDEFNNEAILEKHRATIETKNKAST